MSGLIWFVLNAKLIGDRLCHNMTIQFNKSRLLVSSLALSVIMHILLLYASRMFGPYDFTAPINLTQYVVVELAKRTEIVSPPLNTDKLSNSDSGRIEDDADSERTSAQTKESENNATQTSPEQGQIKPKTASSAVIGSENHHSLTRSSEAASINSSGESPQLGQARPNLTPLSPAGEFLTAKKETLTYQISMLGFPVGNAVLESKIENGEVWITLRVTSNAAISSVFPVDDIVETRHIDGRFIMTKIKQQEGSFRSDEEFTINLMKKRVTYINNIRNRSLNMIVPTDKVLDTLSGFYYLRNRQLQIGKTETLHIFDSETYADVPVEILRRETMRLPNLQKVDTLVVRPLQTTAGILRRTGDILIWMTDDANKVPVKIITSVALGEVTVELVSAESKPLEEDVKESEL